MVDYKLKWDVIINGMEFKEGQVVNIPQERILEIESNAPIIYEKKDKKHSKNNKLKSKDLVDIKEEIEIEN